MTSPILIGQFVLYAEQSLALGDRCRVVGGDVGVRSVAKESDDNHLAIGSHARVDVDREAIAPSVLLGRQVTHGPLLTDGILDDHIALRSQHPFPASAMPPLPLASAPPAGSSNVTVDAGEVLSLTPGAYGSLVVRGSLVLNPGEYVFSSITVDFDAQLAAVGPVRLAVLDYSDRDQMLVKVPRGNRI
jgi:hypothetical protein